MHEKLFRALGRCINFCECFIDFHNPSGRRILYESAPCVKKLDLSGRSKTLEYINGLDEKYDKLVNIFVKADKLNEIVLSRSFFSKGFLEGFIGRLVTGCSKLRALSFSGCMLDNECLKWVLSSIGDCSRINYLDLSHNIFNNLTLGLISDFVMRNRRNMDLYIVVIDNTVEGSKLQMNVDLLIEKVQNFQRKLPILLSRKYDHDSVFSEYNLPLDLLKAIFYYI